MAIKFFMRKAKNCQKKQLGMNQQFVLSSVCDLQSCYVLHALRQVIAAIHFYQWREIAFVCFFNSVDMRFGGLPTRYFKTAFVIFSWRLIAACVSRIIIT
jgi:hypothetical protein